MKKIHKVIISSGIGIISLILAYVPLPGVNKTIIIVSGTELTEPLKAIETIFESENPDINLELKFQGSQELIYNYLGEKNDFNPTILIPASGELLAELNQSWEMQNQGDAFYQQPQPIAKTFLVAIGWSERSKSLFTDGHFSWQKIQQAIQAGSWQTIGGKSEWGSFDFIMTDPNRSNSGQLTLSLWIKAENLNLNDSKTAELLATIKQGVYLPPRSTDILLQEFIARGPNDADIATVYESIALYRWQQSGVNQDKPYQIYYINPTIETVATAAIVTRNISQTEAKAAQEFIEFLLTSQQQEIFAKYGFRPVDDNIDLDNIPNSPWQQNIPGVETNPDLTIIDAPTTEEIKEIQRLWQRAGY
jgi:ABC-type molybdate transport system substrate-binding protein